MTLQILIVEDEVLIAQTIKLYLEIQGHHIQDICISYEEAVKAYQHQKPDLIVLDIHLYGEKSGIDFANFLIEQSQSTAFIYLTSQNDRRIFDLALKTNPYGYLPKPIKKEVLWTTVETAYNLYKKNNSTRENEKISIFDGQTNHSISLVEIMYLEADHVYTTIHLSDNRKISVRQALYQFLEQMENNLLFQCHRSYAINIKYISSWDNQNVILTNNIKIPISRSKKKMLKELLVSV